jgi:Amidohydrolase family
MSGEEAGKGALAIGQLGDLAVLSADYFRVPEHEIRGIESVLTVVGGRIVYGSGPFAPHAPPALPVTPDWSPVAAYGGYFAGDPRQDREHDQSRQCAHGSGRRGLVRRPRGTAYPSGDDRLWGTGCACWAF